MIPGSVEFGWHGEQLVLLPDRAVWLPAHRTLLLADVHLGKPASFRALGVPVPETVTGRDLDRISHLLQTTAATRLVVLGDLVHDQTAMLDRTCHAVRQWRASVPLVEIDLIPGNHDRKASSCERLGVRVLGPWERLGGLVLTHEPPRTEGPATLCGHLHPVVPIGLPGSRSRTRAACFCFGSGTGILPAFGTFTGGLAMGFVGDHALFAAGAEQVIPVTPKAVSWARTTPSGSGAFAYDRP